jgi:hypothetical protein
MTSERRRELDSEKQVYVAPRLKAIYSAPRLTEHGSVVKLTLASTLPAGFHNGNQNQGPPAISSPAVLGTDTSPASDPVTGLPVVEGEGVQKAGDGQAQGGGGDQAQGDQAQGGGGDQPKGDLAQGGGGDQAQGGGGGGGGKAKKR